MNAGGLGQFVPAGSGYGDLWAVIRNWFDPWSYVPSAPPPPPAGATVNASEVYRELNRLIGAIGNGIERARASRRPELEATGRELAAQLGQAYQLAGQDLERARATVTELGRRVHVWLLAVGDATAGGRLAFERARAGSSVSAQVGATVGESVRAMTGNPWVLPLGLVLLVLVLRR